jgi:hypothetical protein
MSRSNERQAHTKLVYYDSRINLVGRRRRKPPDLRRIITLNQTSGRIYVSAGAIEVLGLVHYRITLVQSAVEPTRLWVWPDDERGFELVYHFWCYYVNSKETIRRILDPLSEEGEVVELEVVPESEMVAGRKMFPLRLLTRKPPVALVLERFKREDFPGRIKTQEIDRLERVALQGGRGKRAE